MKETSRALALLLLLLSVSAVGSEGEDSLRTAGKTLAERIVGDAGLEEGTPIVVTWTRGVSRELEDGVLEGFLDWGLTVVTQKSADGRGSVLIEFTEEESGRIAVRISSGESGAFILVRSYDLTGEGESLLTRWGVPIILSAAAGIIVYLLLTVRSS